MASEPWTDEENDQIVADYFAMLSEDLAGRSCNKAERNRNLQARIARSRASIEFKHRNISAVLRGLGEAWLTGYIPTPNFQNSLIDAVLRWFDNEGKKNPNRPLVAGSGDGQFPFEIDPSSPIRDDQLDPDYPEQARAIARKIDVAQRDKQNRKLGKAGERLVVKRERLFLNDAGRGDLAERVRWVAEEDGDGAGYDIESFEADGKTRLIEVKTTNGWERTPFYLTDNELAVSEQRKENWLLLRLYDFSRQPRAFELRPPLRDRVSLKPKIFQADFD